MAYLSIAWVTGICSGSLFDLPPFILLLGLVPLCLLPFLVQHRKTIVLATCCLLALLGGNLRYQSSQPVVNEHLIQFYNEQGTVQISGMVITEPETRDKTSSFQFSVKQLHLNNTSKSVSGKMLIRVPRYKSIHYGDMLQVTGKLETPPQFDDFDYKGFLARQNIYSITNYPRIEVTDTNKGLKPLAWIYSLRNRLSGSLTQALSGPQASLAKGILLGLRGDISPSMMDAFSRTGTAHLLAISGINLTIVMGIFLSAGIWLLGRRRFVYIWLALGIIWLYALVTGMKAPVVRATIMGSMLLLGEYLGRQRSTTTALTFAAAIMVGIDPLILWDASFQLSFLAMAGLAFIAPLIQTLAKKATANVIGTDIATTPACNFIIDSFAVTLAAIIATWPVTAYNFNILSLVGLPATFFALLAMPGIIVTTAITSIVGLFLPILAKIVGYISWLFLSYFMLVIKTFDKLPFASVKADSIQTWQVWLYYALLAAITVTTLCWKQLSNFLRGMASETRLLVGKASTFVPTKYKGWIFFALLASVCIVWTAIIQIPDDKLHISVLDVGQGDAILIQTPNGQDILIDGGPSPRAISLALGEKLPFWDRTIDLIVLTQPQADHLTGLVEVLNNYKVGLIIEPNIEYNSEIYQEWDRLVKVKDIKHKITHSGQEIELGHGLRIDVLNPPPGLLNGTSDDVDNNGLVLRLSYNDVSFLFTADIGLEAERHLVAQRAKIKSTVLKAAHHGSKTSTSSEFLAVVDPEVAVISVGSSNRLNLPNPEVTGRLIKQLGENRVYTTANNGTIEFITDGKRLWAKNGW
ncbi:MAG: DNA internalization-related competence protein ComEC/Rec2 [Chloroflexi bacterium]|nr:DNA internalization-related competence protein ComEC/Rec2 [Chloroflexota bacterium]